MTFTIETKRGNQAKTIIKKLKIKNMFIAQWLDIKFGISCIILTDNGIIKSFALISKMDFDPYKTQSRPHLINFIYTLPEYRNNNFGYEILSYISKNIECTAVCNNDISISLFERAGYKRMPYEYDNICPLYRNDVNGVKGVKG